MNESPNNTAKTPDENPPSKSKYFPWHKKQSWVSDVLQGTGRMLSLKTAACFPLPHLDQALPPGIPVVTILRNAFHEMSPCSITGFARRCSHRSVMQGASRDARFFPSRDSLGTQFTQEAEADLQAHLLPNPVFPFSSGLGNPNPNPNPAVVSSYNFYLHLLPHVQSALTKLAQLEERPFCTG